MWVYLGGHLSGKQLYRRKTHLKLLLSCMVCQKENGKPSSELMMVEFRDDGRYKSTCSNGHTQTTFLQEQKFEILFEIGANAILDGYYREAVSSFTSSLERFYEFVIRLACSHESMPDELYKKCWKSVSNQSERQLGAYIYLWGVYIKNPPLLLKNSDISFRNSVIHKGKIPTKEEAESYGAKVYELIASGLAQIRATPLKNSIMTIVNKHIRDTRGDTKAENVAFTSAPTIISLTVSPDEHYKKSLGEHLIELGKRRNIYANSGITT